MALTWSEVEDHIRGRLAETSVTNPFWPSADLQRWYNVGAKLQHDAVFRAAKAMESNTAFRTYEHDYLKHFLQAPSAGVTTVGEQDYPLPADFWRLARITISASPEFEADPVHWNEDWEIRNLPHRAPTPSRPKYALIPGPTAQNYKARFYVAPGNRTLPNAAIPYKIYYYRDINPADRGASPPNDVDLPDAYHAAPIAWACYEAQLKQYQDGSTFQQEFQTLVQSVIEGPSPEVPGGPAQAQS
jgi:hypothetical protein